MNFSSLIIILYTKCCLQVQLYEDFAKSRAKKDLDTTVGNAMKKGFEYSDKKQGSSHIFQVMQCIESVYFSKECIIIYVFYSG